jgi:hypothetical protein
MAATVAVKEAYGAGPTLQTITQGRYCTTDNYNPGDTYPCVVPSASFNYSYWKHHCLAISGTYTSVSNIRWYTSGSVASNWALGTGGCLLVGVLDTPTLGNGCPSGDYDQATGTQGTTGDYMKHGSNGHAYYKGETADPQNADNYVSGTPLDLDLNTYGPNATVNSYYVVTQVKIASDATQGDKPNETFTFRYDEI